MRANSGGVKILVRGTPSDLVESALGMARDQILQIRHPEEPDDPFASFVSEVEESDEGWSLTLDMADAEVYEGVLEAALEAVVLSLEESGTAEAVVGFPVGAVIETAHAPLAPPVATPPPTVPVEMPSDFPLPIGARLTATLVVEGRCVREYMIDAPFDDPVQFYATALDGQGYAVTGIEEEPECRLFKRRYFFGFQGRDIVGLIMVSLWPRELPGLGFAGLRVDTWRA
jgi:hypothetical protein